MEVYFNLESFPNVRQDETLVSLFRHEAFHVALDSRNESLWSQVTAAGSQLPESPHQHCFQAAAIACDEFRVEAAIPRKDVSVDGFLDFADSCEVLIAGASLQYEFDHQDVGEVWTAVTEPFNALVVQAGYVAAVCSASASQAVPKRGLLVTDKCVELVSTLQRLPPASEPTHDDRLREVLRDAAEIVDQWMREVGFAVELVGKDFCFRVLEPELWIKRGLELAREARDQAAS